MSRIAKTWLIIASSLILIGCIIFGGSMTMLGWDLSKLSTVKYETNNYEINENYIDISITANTADVVFIPSENSNCSVECYEQSNLKHSIKVKNNTLTIEVVDSRKWYEHIGINFGTPKITVYIPRGEYGTLWVKSSTGDIEIPKEFKFKSIDISESTGDVTNRASASAVIKIKTSTGDIRVDNISAGALDLSVSTGKIFVSDVICESDVNINVSTGKTNLTDIKCKKVISGGNTGDIYLKNVIATEKFSIKRSTGNVKFDDCDAAEIFVETDTGDVNGSLLTNKVFITKTDTGRISIPNSITGGKCEIVTNTGDIKIQNLN